MITMKNLLRNEKGQALPLALIALSLGALLVGGFLSNTSTNLIATQVFKRATQEHYAADSGVEDAIWDLIYGNFRELLTRPGDSISYSPTESINKYTPEVIVTRGQSPIGKAPAILANDNFESRSWVGGSGWLVEWSNEKTKITDKQGPYEGTYHVEINNEASYLARSANLSDQSDLYLQVWTKAKDFKESTLMQLLVSSDGSQWTTAKTWTIADSDDTYHLNNIDLSLYTMSSEFWIAFDWGNFDKKVSFYVDDLVITGGIITYEIVSTAAKARITAVVEFENDGTLTILSWQID